MGGYKGGQKGERKFRSAHHEGPIDVLPLDPCDRARAELRLQEHAESEHQPDQDRNDDRHERRDENIRQVGRYAELHAPERDRTEHVEREHWARGR